jgi:hypothetical protein
MRTRVLVVMVAVAVALAGCTKQQKADDVDRQRIAAMKGEPIVAGIEGVAREGAADGGDFAPNAYSANLASRVVAATPLAARAQAATVLGQLRSQGWTVISARCAPPAQGTYAWEAFAYKVKADVAYSAQLTAGYSRDSGLTINLAQQAPFHSDTRPRLQPAPTALDGGTCVEQGDVEQPAAAQGTTWSLFG